jgi:aryl sulfotransferase
MRQDANQLLPEAEGAWKGGTSTFLFKGVNGRWKDVLSPEELTLHTEAVARVLTPACADWLEHGRTALR